jgi:AcrR family transcriptional regulator
MRGHSPSSSHTRQRLLEAAELLFVELGYEAMSLRQVTARAHANLAAVNYHFGGKEALMHELLTLRLAGLNAERLRLLTACQAHWPSPPDAAAILGTLFVPALRLAREPAGGPCFMRLLGRVYSDPSPFIRDYLQEHYRPIFARFFDAFSAALPQLPRAELGLRLHFGLKALAGMLAGEDVEQLASALRMGQDIGEAELLARLVSLIAPTLTGPLGSAGQVQAIERVIAMADADAAATSGSGGAGRHRGKDP